MQILLHHTNLTDAWAVSHPPPPVSAPDLYATGAAAGAAEAWGLTCDSPLNTWSHSKPLDAVARKWLGKRLDYVLFRSPLPHDGPSLVIRDSKMVLTDRVPGYDFSFSDHFGLEATFSLVRQEGLSSGRAVEEAVRIEDSLAKAPTEMSDTMLLTAIDALMFEYRASLSRTRQVLIYFVSSVILLLLTIIGSGWIRASSWVAPIATFVGALATWAGTTSLYVGFIFGKWERNMLMNIIDEMETLRDGTR